MSNEESVKPASMLGRTRQWATGIFYRREGRKMTLVRSAVSIFCITSFLVLALLVAIFGNSEPQVQEARNTISAPQELSQAERVDLPSAAHGGESTPEARAKTGRLSKRASQYAGPQIVRRNNTAKIPPGTMIRAVLISGASDGPVRAQATEGVELNGETLIEPGTVLLGVGQSTDDRLYIRFSQMVFKDGGFTSIQAQACDATDKVAGLKGSKVGTQAFKLAASIGLNFVGGMSQALQESDFQTGYSYRSKSSARNVLMNGASTAALEQSQELMNEYRNKPAKMEASAGVPLFVLFEVN